MGGTMGMMGGGGGAAHTPFKGSLILPLSLDRPLRDYTCPLVGFKKIMFRKGLELRV